MSEQSALWQRLRIVLVNTTHPGNIGAVARAMKTMGFTRLYLVHPLLFPHAEATARAAGADEILAQAVITTTLDEAISDCGLVLGSSARLRALSLPLLNPRQAAAQISAELPNTDVAVVFGQERSGLSNAELQCCHYQLHIPTNSEFSSLNLAAAVQLMVYELRMALLLPEEKMVLPNTTEPLATAQQLQYFYQHLEETLVAIEFLQPQHKRQMMLRLQRLFNRTRVEETELNILRGILTAAQRQVVNHKV